MPFSKKIFSSVILNLFFIVFYPVNTEASQSSFSWTFENDSQYQVVFESPPNWERVEPSHGIFDLRMKHSQTEEKVSLYIDNTNEEITQQVLQELEGEAFEFLFGTKQSTNHFLNASNDECWHFFDVMEKESSKPFGILVYHINQYVFVLVFEDFGGMDFIAKLAMKFVNQIFLTEQAKPLNN